jgi:GNAT acetyltransferase-like protein
MLGMSHPYGSEAYARAFEGIAEPLLLPTAGRWVLRRQIPGTAYFDAIGCYPLTAWPRHTSLSADFPALRQIGIVSLVLVADALFAPAADALARDFELARPFKSHYVHDYAQPFHYGRHHRYEVKRAREACQVGAIVLSERLREWNEFYKHLCMRHGVSGLQRFSPLYFERLAALPQLRALAAWHRDELVGIHVFIQYEGTVYSHLAAFSPAGYTARAGYALNDYAIEYFRGSRLIDFGAGAGVTDDSKDGLAVFKRGFANRSERFFLCGEVLDREIYDRLAGTRPREVYFPAYRSP